MIKFENTKNALGGTKAAVAAETKRVMLRDIGAKWGRLTEEDIATLGNPNDLVNKLVAKYGANKEEAAADVQRFLKGRTF